MFLALRNTEWNQLPDIRHLTISAEFFVLHMRVDPLLLLSSTRICRNYFVFIKSLFD